MYCSSKSIWDADHFAVDLQKEKKKGEAMTGSPVHFFYYTDNCNLRQLAVIAWRLSTISCATVSSLPLFMTKRSAAPSSHFITHSNASAQWCMALLSLPDLLLAGMAQQTCKGVTTATFISSREKNLCWIYPTSVSPWTHLGIHVYTVADLVSITGKQEPQSYTYLKLCRIQPCVITSKPW